MKSKLLKAAAALLFAATADAQPVHAASSCVIALAFNLERQATADPAVPRAIAHAIDRERLLLEADSAPVRVTSVPSEHDFHPVRATQLLEHAGYHAAADAPRLALELVHLPALERYGRAIGEGLARIGVRVVQRPLERSTLYDVLAKRDFDLVLVSYCHEDDRRLFPGRLFFLPLLESGERAEVEEFCARHAMPLVGEVPYDETLIAAFMPAQSFCAPSSLARSRSKVPSGRCPALRAISSSRQSEKPGAGRLR
jgi:hypothetical protein